MMNSEMAHHVPTVSEVFEPSYRPESADEAKFSATAHRVRASCLSDAVDELVNKGLAPSSRQVNEAADAALAAAMLDSWALAMAEAA